MIFGLTKDKAHTKLQRAFDTGDFTDAIDAYKKLIKKGPSDHELFNNLGMAYLESGRLSESIEAFREANRLMPACAHLSNLGSALLQQKDFQGARTAFADARKLDPTDPKPWFNMTVTLREEGRSEDAYRELLEFLGVHPTHANGLGDLGCYQLDRGETAEAIDSFTKALDNNQNALGPRLNLIRTLCDAGRYPDATPHLDMLARSGFNVKVYTEGETVAIDINGSPFYRGTVRT